MSMRGGPSNRGFSELLRAFFGTSPSIRQTAGLAYLYRSARNRTVAALTLPFRIVDAREVPRSDSLPYGNLGKVVETAVLYVDIRGSTELHTYNDPLRVARMLKAFLREMAQVARHYGAYIRGIAGDRLMVVTEMEVRAATKALEIGISMRDVVQMVLNPIFQKRLGSTLAVGIGSDFGPMLAIKVGMQRTVEHSDLVWVGTPANVASKLTDKAQPSEILLSQNAYARVDHTLYPAELWSSRMLEVAGQQLAVFSLKTHVSFGVALARAGL